MIMTMMMMFNKQIRYKKKEFMIMLNKVLINLIKMIMYRN